MEFAGLVPDLVLVGLQAQLARAYMLRGDDARAIATVERVLEVAEHADLVPVLADALVTRGSALCNGGRLREGLAVIEAGERLASANGLTWTALRGLNNRLSSQWLIDTQACVDGAREGLALAGRVGARNWIFTFLQKSMYALWLTGEWDAALATALRALDEGPEPADRLELLHATIVIRAARGEPVDTAPAELSIAAPEVTDPQILWTTVDAAAFPAFAEGRFLEAGRMWREGAPRWKLKFHDWLYRAATTALLCGDAAAAAGDLAQLDTSGLHAPLVEARGAVIRAGLAALEGDLDRSARLFERALRDFQHLNLPFEEASAAIVMATVLDPASPEVRSAAERARAILVGLRAEPFLDQLEAAHGHQPGPSSDRVDGPSLAVQSVSVRAEP